MHTMSTPPPPPLCERNTKIPKFHGNNAYYFSDQGVALAGGGVWHKASVLSCLPLAPHSSLWQN